MIRGKHLIRIALALVLLVVIGGVAAIAVLESGTFHRFVLRLAAEKASQATGGKVTIGDFQIQWSGLRLDVENVVFRGTEAASNPPLAQVDHVMVGLKIVSIWHHKIDLRELAIDHPSIHMSVDPQGHSNLPPSPPSAPGAPSTSVFDLAVGHFVVTQGELDYNDRQTPLAAEVHDLQAQIGFDSAKTEYDGTLGYRDGRIQFGDFNPVQHGVQVQFSATPSALDLKSAVLSAGSSTVSVQAQIQNFSDPSVAGTYQASLATGELAKIMKAASVPVGMVNLQGTLHYQNRAGQPFLGNLSTNGGFGSPMLAVNTPQVHTRIQSLSGDFQLRDGTLEARIARADVLGGQVSANLTLAHLTDRPAARVEADLKDISLTASSAATNTQPLERAAITGAVNGTVKGSWEGSMENLQVHADATVAASAPVHRAGGEGASGVPLNGAVHADYNGRSETITLTQTELATPHFSVKLDGSTGKKSSLGIQVQSDDLREIDQLMLIARRATATGPAAASAPPAPLGIAGSASFTGQLRGPMNNLQLTGQLSSDQLQYQQATLNEFRVSIAASPSGAALSQGLLRTPDGAQVQFDGGTALKNWAYTPQSALHVDLTAAKLPVALIEQLANRHDPVSGTLGVHVSMHGSQTNLIGQGSLTLTQATAWEQPIQSVNIQVQGAGNTVHSTLDVSTPAGSASGKLTYDFQAQAYEAQLTLPGLQIERLTAIHQKNLPVVGTISASFQGKGTVKDPQVTATIQSPKLTIGQQAIDGLSLHADVAHQQANFTLDSSAQGASIQARGAVNLDANYTSQASLDVRNIQLGTLLAAFMPQAPAGLQGQAEVHGTLHGPLKEPKQVEAEVEIPTLKLSYQAFQIGNASPIRAAYTGGVVSLENCELKGTGTDLQAHATVPIDNPQTLQATATGNIDLHLVQMLYPDMDTSGQVQLDVKASGALAHPELGGTVRLNNVAFESSGMPVGVQKLNATLAIKDGRVEIQNFQGEAGGGTITARGYAAFQPAVQFNMAVNTDKLRLRYPLGTRAILDSRLTLIGSANSALLSGQVLIDRLSLTKEFDLSTFADQFTGNTASSPGPAFAQGIKLNVALKSANEMALASSKLNIQGSADLMVRGTAADPVILGRTDITGGEIFMNGNRYVVESGVIQFVNPVETEPVVNVLVTTVVDQFNLSMNFVGPLDRLRTTYTSDPPLAPIDIINLIATGQTTEAAAASTSSTSPESVIAGQLASQFSSRVEKLAGISSLTIDPQVGGAQGNGVGRLAVQQRVTKNLFFTFSTDLTTTTGAVVQVEYQATKKYALSTIRDQNGGYTVEVKVHKSF